jgi:hypothetical protein
MSRWGYRESTKPTELQENARKIAADAFLEGKMIEGKTILDNARTKLAKPQAKKIAHILAKQGRFDAATEVLLLSNWSAESAKEELAPTPTAQVGNILYTSGGYEQTNVSFYEVVAVSGATATIRKLSKRTIADHRYEIEVVPVPGSFVGVPMKKRIQKSRGFGGNYKLKVGDHSAWLWDGKPQRETAAGYGH